jgi:hypothetical protein
MKLGAFDYPVKPAACELARPEGLFRHRPAVETMR